MGVYIKGIDKPDSCHDCAFNYDWQECMAKIGNNNDMMWDFNKYSPAIIYSTCPLQPIDDEKVEKTQREIVEAWKIFRSVIKDEKL